MKIKIILALVTIFVLGFLVPEAREVPVVNATMNDWNKDSFWYEPWGTSGVHKGVDTFATKGTSVVAAANMLVLYKGSIENGGNVVVGLGPKWRLHYFAHLENINLAVGWFAKPGSIIGTVGDSGNAKGKQPHLHFSILSLVPLPWLMDRASQGYKKAFYLNPIEYFSGGNG
jgi:murein DD-endopeptidase MepM/ murein hydrolase activator NlpD